MNMRALLLGQQQFFAHAVFQDTKEFDTEVNRLFEIQIKIFGRDAANDNLCVGLISENIVELIRQLTP